MRIFRSNLLTLASRTREFVSKQDSRKPNGEEVLLSAVLLITRIARAGIREYTCLLIACIFFDL